MATHHNSDKENSHIYKTYKPWGWLQFHTAQLPRTNVYFEFLSISVIYLITNTQNATPPIHHDSKLYILPFYHNIINLDDKLKRWSKNSTDNDDDDESFEMGVKRFIRNWHVCIVWIPNYGVLYKSGYIGALSYIYSFGLTKYTLRRCESFWCSFTSIIYITIKLIHQSIYATYM